MAMLSINKWARDPVNNNIKRSLSQCLSPTLDSDHVSLNWDIPSSVELAFL